MIRFACSHFGLGFGPQRAVGGATASAWAMAPKGRPKKKKKKAFEVGAKQQPAVAPDADAAGGDRVLGALRAEDPNYFKPGGSI